MTHSDEIKYWAEHPNGTKVWQKFKAPNNEWMLISQGMFMDPESTYIVDDEWAELRKAQTDGKQLQWFNGREWIDKNLNSMDMCEYVSKPKDWRIKSRKFELKYTEPCYLFDDCKNYLEHGRYRQTEDEAKYSVIRNKMSNRLEALAMYVDGLYKPIWDGITKNYYVYYNHQAKEWRYASATFNEHINEVYMSEVTAKSVCKILNSGEYSLEGEQDDTPA